MMRVLFLAAIAFLLLLPVKSYASVPEKEAARTIAKQLALEYGVSFALVDYVITHESSWRPKAIGDMNSTCRKTGKPVRARGYFQLTECWYGHVSDACAFDLKCAAKIALPLIKNRSSCMSQFSTCRRYYLNYNNYSELAGI